MTVPAAASIFKILTVRSHDFRTNGKQSDADNPAKGIAKQVRDVACADGKTILQHLVHQAHRKYRENFHEETSCPARYALRASPNTCTFGAGGLRPIRYTQGHTLTQALRAGGLRPIRFYFGNVCFG